MPSLVCATRAFMRGFHDGLNVQIVGLLPW